MIFDAALDYDRTVLFSDAEGHISETAPSVSLLDHGFLFGDSVYEVVRFYSGKAFAWREHLRRLEGSSEKMGLDLAAIRGDLKPRVQSLLHQLAEPNAVCRIMVTRGPGPLHINPLPCKDPKVYLAAWKFDSSQVPTTLRLKITQLRRNHEKSLSPSIKSGNYLNNVMGLREAIQAGADDCLFLNPEGQLTELSTSNLAWYKDGEWHTPALSCGILAGITRDFFIRSCGAKEVVAGPEAIQSAACVLALSTLKEAVPVQKVFFEDGSARDFEEEEPVAEAQRRVRAAIEEALRFEEVFFA